MVKYDRATHVLPQDTNREELLEVLAVAQPRAQTVSFSVDHALDTVQENHLLHVWGVERIVRPEPDSMEEARQMFIDYCQRAWDFVPEIEWEDFDPPPIRLEPTIPQIGLHDVGGGEWMRQQGMHGMCVHAVALGSQPIAFDFSQFAQDGVQTIVRLNFGFSPLGTIPAEDDAEGQADFIAACRETIRHSRGVWGWIIGNEPRNYAERVGGSTESLAPSPAYYADLYNAIYRGKPADARLSPAPIDPYFGVDGVDPMDWMGEMMAAVDGAEFITIHAKTQGSMPSQVDSEVTFSNPPLRGRRLHFRAYRDVIEHLSDRFFDRPIIISEANPQRFGLGESDNRLGWEPRHAAAWVQAAFDECRAWNDEGRQQIKGLVFYRWDFDEWALVKRPATLERLVALGEMRLA